MIGVLQQMFIIAHTIMMKVELIIMLCIKFACDNMRDVSEYMFIVFVKTYCYSVDFSTELMFNCGLANIMQGVVLNCFVMCDMIDVFAWDIL